MSCFLSRNGSSRSLTTLPLLDRRSSCCSKTKRSRVLKRKSASWKHISAIGAVLLLLVLPLLRNFRTLLYLHRLGKDDHDKERRMDLPTVDSRGETAEAEKIIDANDMDMDDAKKDIFVSDLINHNITTEVVSEETKEEQHSTELVRINCTCVDCSEDEVCGGLWRGNRYPGMASDEEALHIKLHIVVSHCNKSLSWMPSYLEGFTNIASIHIISKCGQEKGAPENATTVVAPNVGRNDHAFAYYISSILPKFTDDNCVVVFLKDSITEAVHQGREYRRADLKSLVRIASSKNGFACGLEIKDKRRSCYHETSTLYGFEKEEYEKGNRDYGTGDGVPFQSTYNTFGDFYRALNATSTSSPDLVQVCYGGIFAASTTHIFKQDMKVWRTMKRALERGDNIQEGHYAERIWAHLLAAPLKPFQIEALRNHSTTVQMRQGRVHGPLVRKR